MITRAANIDNKVLQSSLSCLDAQLGTRIKRKTPEPGHIDTTLILAQRFRLF